MEPQPPSLAPEYFPLLNNPCSLLLQVPPELDLIWGVRSTRLAIEFHSRGKKRDKSEVTTSEAPIKDCIEYVADLYESDSGSVSSESSINSLEAKKLKLEESLWDEAVVGNSCNAPAIPQGDISVSSLSTKDMDPVVLSSHNDELSSGDLKEN